MSAFVRTFNGIPIYFHTHRATMNVALGYLNIPLDAPAKFRCSGVSCHICPISTSTRESTLGVSNLNGSGCTECVHVLASTIGKPVLYRRA